MKSAGALTVTTPSDREILITRTLDAPRHLVWNALTKPEFLRRWLLGPPGWEMTVCDEDLREGGGFRYQWRNLDGSEMAMSGVYREVVPPQPGGAGGKVTRTETFEFGCTPQAGEQLSSMALTEHPRDKARTIMTITVLFPTKEARDGMIASGMEHGMEASYAKLDELLASQKG